MKKVLFFMLLAVQACFANEAIYMDTKTHKVIKPDASTSAMWDIDFSDVTTNLSGGTGTGSPPGGQNLQLQFNNSGLFGGVPWGTYDGTAINFTGGARLTLSDPNITTAKVRFDLSNIPADTIRTVRIVNDSNTVVGGFAPDVNSFVQSVLPDGTQSYVQPLFINIGGSLPGNRLIINPNRLLGHGASPGNAGEEISLGTNLSMTGTTLNATGGGGSPGGGPFQLQWNDTGTFNGLASLTTDGTNVFGTATRFYMIDPIDNTKWARFELGSAVTGTISTVQIAANSTTVRPDTGATNNFLTSIGTTGIVGKAQPTFSNIGGIIGLGQNNMPIGKNIYVDSINGQDITAVRGRLDKPYLTIGNALAVAQSGDVVYIGPGTYAQSTTPLVVPANVSLYGSGQSTLITGSVGLTRAVVEPGNSSVVSDIKIQNTATNGAAFGVGPSSAAFSTATLASSIIIGNSNGIYLNKTGASGLLVQNCQINTTGYDAEILTVGTHTFRDTDFISDGTSVIASRAINAQAGIVLVFNSGMSVGNSLGTNVAVTANGSGTIVELHNVLISRNSTGTTNFDLQQQSSAVLAIDNITRDDYAALTTSGTITEISRYLVNRLATNKLLGRGTAGTGPTEEITLGTNLSLTGTTLNAAGGGGSVDDTAWSSAMNGQTTVAPTLNMIYDWGHTFDTDDDGKVNVLDQAGGITNTNSGGVIQLPLVAPIGAIVGTIDTQKLLNKRIQKRELATSAPGGTPSINTDNYDVVHYTGLNAAITSITTTGIPDSGDSLSFDFTDNGTSRTIAWDSSNFEPSPGQALPTTTTANTRLDVGFRWNPVTNKWRCLASSEPSGIASSTNAWGGSETGHGDTNYTILNTDKIVFTNAVFTATRTWTLPAASTVQAGYAISVVDQFGTVTTTNRLKLQASGTDIFYPTTAATYEMSSAFQGVTLVSDGTSKWYAISVQPGGGSGTFAQQSWTSGVWAASLYTLPTSIAAAGRMLRSNGSNVLFSAATYPDASTITGKILRGLGGNFVETTATYPDTAVTNGNVLTVSGGNWVEATPTGGGNVSNSGTPTVNQLPIWVTATTIKGVTGVTGGTTGQVLKKNSATDYDWGWASDATGGSVDDTAYDATSWDGVTSIPPSKNAVRDKIETLLTAAAIDDTAYAGTWNGIGTIAPSKNAVFDKINSLLSDGVYDATWNGVVAAAPTKNAVYDQLHKFDTADDGSIISAGTGFRIAGAAATGTILKGNGTNYIASTETYAAPGASGNLMQSNGTNWISATPPPSISSGSDAAFTVPQTITVTDAFTTAVTQILTLDHETSGTPGTGLGAALNFNGKSNSTAGRLLGRLEYVWLDPVDASRTSYLDFVMSNSGTVSSKMRLYGSGGLNLGGSTEPPAGIVSASTGFRVNNVSATSGKILKSSSGGYYADSIETYPSPGSAGNTMQSDGTNWVSGSPAYILCYTKSVSNLTTGTPADIGTITIPVGVTRWRLQSGATAPNSGSEMITETQTGTPAAGTMAIFTAAAGGGTQLWTTTAPSAGVGAGTGVIPLSNSLFTVNTLYIRQMANSANSATISFYVVVNPYP